MVDARPASEADAAGPASGTAAPEVSFVLPCLDEAETLGDCIAAARRCIQEHGLAAEILVADNGSRDNSRAIASRAGARVVEVSRRGYGSALMGGFEAARGRILVMGDADGSYDFAAAIDLIRALRAGADLAMGARARVLPGAMPWLHRWVGNPLLSWVGRRLFRAPVSDFHCGLRALTREAYVRLGLRTTGMEFATEMIAKASLRKLRIAEVPIVLHPDGRSRGSHLRTWRDGWRHLRFMLCLSPWWTLFAPGLLLASAGALGLAWIGLAPRPVGAVVFDVHTLVAASLAVLVGYQAMTTAVAARLFAFEEELGPPSPWLWGGLRHFSLERGILAGLALAGAGGACIVGVLIRWAQVDFGDLDVQVTLRPMILGATGVALGAQTLLMSFLYSMLGIERRRDSGAAGPQK